MIQPEVANQNSSVWGLAITADAIYTNYTVGFDAFASKLNADGSALVYSTFLAGIGVDQGMGIVTDAGGSAYVVGTTTSSNFPTTPGSFQRRIGGLYDLFVIKLNPDGSLAFSTYLGGCRVRLC